MLGPNQQGVKPFACPLLFAAMAIVTAGYPVIAMNAAIVAVHTPVIRIGPPRHNYVYRLHFHSGVYRCDRGNEWALMGDRLFLFRNPDGPGP